MIKLRSKRFCRSSSKLRGGDNGGNKSGKALVGGGEIKWELRPGGMLVQKRESCGDESINGEGIIIVRVSTVSQWHHISIQSTSTFGELKMILSLVTDLKAKEQRILYKGKEREDEEYLHMVGVRDKDKVLLLEDPAIKEQKKLLGPGGLVGTSIGTPYQTITV